MLHRLFTNNELKSLNLALISALGFKKKSMNIGEKDELKSLILVLGF